MIVIVPAEIEHIHWIMQHVRPEDRDELWAAARATPQECMRYGIVMGRESWTGLVDGNPIVMCGVTSPSIMSDEGSPWLVATNDLEKHGLEFLKLSRRMARIWFGRYTSLQNWVDIRNEKAVQWLQWLGFEMEEPAPFGPFAMPFRRFHRGM